MSEAFNKILDIRKDHMKENFEVLAIRVDKDTYDDLLCDRGTVMEHTPGWDVNFDYGGAEALVCEMEIIPDDSISEPVAEDVRGMWRDRMEEGTITKWGQI